MQHPRLLPVILVAHLAPLLFAQGALALNSAPPTPSLAFERFTLKNGLEVIVHEDRRVPVVDVDLWIHVGSGDEVVGKSGFAHLFEHMMFQGSRNVAEDKHMAILREAGGSNLNGTTNFDRTNYFETMPQNQLETALWLESDRLGFLLDHVNNDSLKNQIDVVRNERRQRIDNVPYGASYMAQMLAAFPEGHPYRYSVIGKHEDLESAKLDDVHAFFKKWYAPSNATLALAGDIDAKTARALAEKWFGDLPSPPKPAHTAPPMPTLKENVRVEVKDSFAKLTRLQLAWHAPARFSIDDVDLNALADVLGQNGWGRLYKVLVVEKQLAQSVSVSVDSMGFSSLFTVSVLVKPGVALKDVEGAVKREMLKALDRGPTEAELMRSTVDTETSLLFGLDPVHGRAEILQTFNHYTGDPGYLPKYLEAVRTRTPETVRKAARRWLAKPRVEIVTIPSDAPPPAVDGDKSPASTWRQSPPGSTPSDKASANPNPKAPGGAK